MTNSAVDWVDYKRKRDIVVGVIRERKFILRQKYR